MKTLVCWLLLSLFPLVSVAEDLSWTTVTLSEPVAVGYAAMLRGVGFRGELGWINGGRRLWITHDAGRNWEISLSAPEGTNFRDAYFLDALEGWAVTALPNFLFHTGDGGETWQVVEFELVRTSTDLPLEGFLASIYFKDSLHGLGVFAVQRIQGGFSVIARTDDGGKRWTEIWIRRQGIFGRSIGIDDQVWVDYHTQSRALYTSDFGQTFQELPRSFISPDFLRSGYGWTLDWSALEAGFQRWELVATVDSGFSWSSPILSLQSASPSPYMDACLMAEGVGVVLWYPSGSDDSGLLYFTSDGGGIWSQHTVVSGYRLACNRESQDLWLIPSLEGGEKNSLFVTSISSLTAVNPRGNLVTLWGTIKNRKE